MTWLRHVLRRKEHRPLKKSKRKKEKRKTKKRQSDLSCDIKLNDVSEEDRR